MRTWVRVVTYVIFTVLYMLVIWSDKSHAQTVDQARIDHAVQVVRELCLVGKQYNLYIDAKGNIVIKSLRPGIEGYAGFSASEAKGATAIYDEKLRIIADAEVRNCTKEHLPRIIDVILGQKIQTSQDQSIIEPTDAEKSKATGAHGQLTIKPSDPEGLKVTAVALVKEGEEGRKWSSSSGRDVNAGSSLIDEYNQLVRRAIFLFKTDPYIQSLKEVDKEKFPDVAANKVKRLAEEVAIYMASFEASKALRQTAIGLVKGGEEGRKWSSSSGRDVNAGNSLIWEYNYVVRRAKILFGAEPSLQVFEEISEERYPDVAARKVERLASELERALASL